jgi:hypothetical protein
VTDLDDAIRAHLELKRQHGADPREVARQAEEALGSVSYEPEPAFASEHYAAYAVEALPEFAPEHQAEVHTLADHAQSRTATNAGYQPPADTATHAAPATADWGRAQLDGGDETQEFSIEELDFGWVGPQQLRGTQRAS